MRSQYLQICFNQHSVYRLLSPGLLHWGGVDGGDGVDGGGGSSLGPPHCSFLFLTTDRPQQCTSELEILENICI